jgi:sugar phosphate permease
VGVISSLIVLISIIFRLAVGALTDKINKRQLIKLGSILYAFGWIGKIFIQTAFQIFVVSSYHSLASIIRRTPFTTLMYEQAADRGHYVDEYTVLREISLNIGRVLMLLLLFVLFFFVGLNFAFILAAFASLLINTL